MKAVNLQQTIQFFNPAEPLSGQALHTWFVARPQTPRQFMRVLLQSERDPIKILFVGHRGSGKSTELNKLAEELAETFVTVPFDVLEITGRTTPGYEDLMLTLSTQVTRYCIMHGLFGQPLSAPLQAGWQQLSDWWRRVVAGIPLHTPAAETATYATLSTFLGEIEVGARQSSKTREFIKDQVNQQMPELIRHFNWVLEQAQAVLNPKRLLLVVEGLDKVDLEAARNILRDHAPTITAPHTAMIYTCPLALRHSDDYDTVRRGFNDDCFLHNWATHHADGAPNETGMATLRHLVLTRLEMRLIADDALDLAVDSCGGVPVQLVKLMRSAAVYALVRDENARQIILADMQEAANDLRRELSAPLRRDDWQRLRACYHHRQLTNDAEMRRLLYNGSLIEYANDNAWCNVHPVLWPLLDGYTED